VSMCMCCTVQTYTLGTYAYSILAPVYSIHGSLEVADFGLLGVSTANTE
jgi:hypothetical protein